MKTHIPGDAAGSALELLLGWRWPGLGLNHIQDNGTQHFRSGEIHLGNSRTPRILFSPSTPRPVHADPGERHHLFGCQISNFSESWGACSQRGCPVEPQVNKQAMNVQRAFLTSEGRTIFFPENKYGLIYYADFDLQKALLSYHAVSVKCLYKWSKT